MRRPGCLTRRPRTPAKGRYDRARPVFRLIPAAISVLIEVPMESGHPPDDKDATMKHASVTALGLLVAALTTSCGLSAMQTPSRPVQPMDVRDNQPPRPQIRRNPQPTAYEVTMTIENAPGPFASVKAAMQYEVLDERCMPDLGGMAGTRASLLEWVPVELQQVSGTTYRGEIYDNLLADEDYFGLGVCDWSLVSTQFKLSAGKSEDDARFSHHLFHKQIVEEGTIRAHYWRGHYPRDEEIAKMPVPGEEDIGKFKNEFRDELFTILFKVEASVP